MNLPHSTTRPRQRRRSQFIEGLRTIYRTHDFLSSTPVILGTALGVSILYSGWIEHIAVWYAPLFTAILGGSYYFGITRSTRVTADERLTAGIAYCLVSCVFMAMPYSVAWGWHRYQATQCFLPPGATEVTVNVDPIRWNETPHWSVRYKIGLPVSGIRDFYIRAISQEENGVWLSSPTAFPRSSGIDNSVFNITSDERKLDVAIFHKGYMNEVEIRAPGFDAPPPELDSRRR